MSPLIASLALELIDLPPPPGASPSATAPASPVAATPVAATPEATPSASPAATTTASSPVSPVAATPDPTPLTSPVATPLVEATAGTAVTPTVGPRDTEPGSGLDGSAVVLVVAAVLGAVVLIAWLLKPLVARRIAQETAAGRSTAGSGETPSREWSWEQSRHDAAATVATTDVVTVSSVSIDVDGAPAATDAVEPSTPEVERGGTVRDVPPVPMAEGDATVDTDDLVGITLTVRELLEYANAGQLLRGFDLYSESYLRRFRAESGLTDEEFAQEFGSVPAPPEARIELAAVTGVEVLPDGRVGALISFGSDNEPSPPERFVFVRVDGRWLIDDIATAG